MASPKHRAFTWSYRFSIYRIHWLIFIAHKAWVPVISGSPYWKSKLRLKSQSLNHFDNVAVLEQAYGYASLNLPTLSLFSFSFGEKVHILSNEIKLDFARTMNKISFDKTVTNMPQKFWYVTLPEDEKPVIPERGRMMQGCEAVLEIENMARAFKIIFSRWLC